MTDETDPSTHSAQINPPLRVSRRDVISHGGLLGVAGLLSPNFFALLPEPAMAQESAHALASASRSTTQENHAMPLVRIDAFEGRSESEIKTLLDAAHRAIVKAFHINERDRYQIFDAHPKSRFIMQDTGLGIPRTDKALIVTVFSKARAEVLKRRLYKELTDELQRSAGTQPSDVMIAIVENGAADWTFGNGEPQFLTGDLA